MKSNGWGAWLTRILFQLPYLVAGIEQIHGDSMNGASKKQLAMESLGLASQGASGLMPDQQNTIAVATSLVSSAIDGVKAVYNSTKTNAPAVPAAVPASAIATAKSPDASTGIAPAPLPGSPTTGN